MKHAVLNTISAMLIGSLSISALAQEDATGSQGDDDSIVTPVDVTEILTDVDRIRELIK